jgi:hypothetical protein
LNKIQVAGGIDREHFLRDLQSLGVAIGLGLQGTGIAKANVNLLSTTEQLERVLKSKRWAAVVLVVLLGVAFAVNFTVVGNVMKANAGMSHEINKKFALNEVGAKDSREVLNKVGPVAAELKSYSGYGRKGVVHAAFEGVLGTMQDFIKEKGLINPEDLPPEKGGPPLLQAIYIESIEVPSFPYEKANGPFRPTDSDRMVRIKVRIPRVSDALKSLPQQIVDKLKVLPAPDYLKGFYPTDRLFADAQIKNDETRDDAYWLVDNTQADATTGTFKAVKESRKLPVRVVTFECHFINTSAVAAPATGQ